MSDIGPVHPDGSFNIEYDFFGHVYSARVVGLNIVEIKRGSRDFRSSETINHSLGIVSWKIAGKCSSYWCRQAPKDGDTCEKCSQEINNVQNFDNHTKNIRVYKNLIYINDKCSIRSVICEKIIIPPSIYLQYPKEHRDLSEYVKDRMIEYYWIFRRLDCFPIEIIQEIFTHILG